MGADNPSLIFSNLPGACFAELWLVDGMLYRTEPNDPRPSLAGNPLVASVLRENVQIFGDRAMIGLRGTWPSLLAEIASFGKVLAISRNAYAVLGWIKEYPEVQSGPCEDRGQTVDGSLEFDFACWRQTAAVVETRPGGWLYAVEFLDQRGEVIHKICLTEQSDFEAFRSWVELSQTPCVPARFEVLRRASWLENTLILCASGARKLESEGLCALFQMMAAKRSAFQAIVGNDATVQAARIAPTIFSRNGQWIFAGGENSGLHVRVERLAEVYLHEVGESCVMKACDPEGHLVCALMATNDGDAGPWNEELQKVVEIFSTDQT